MAADDRRPGPPPLPGQGRRRPTTEVPPIPEDAPIAGPPKLRPGPPPPPVSAVPRTGEQPLTKRRKRTDEQPQVRPAPRSRRARTGEPEQTLERPSPAQAAKQPTPPPTPAVTPPQALVPPPAVDPSPVEPSGPIDVQLTAQADAILTSLHGFLEQESDVVEEDNRHGRAVLLHELGNLEELILQDRGRAASRQQRAVEIDNTFIPALRAVRRLLASDGRWRDYLGMLDAEIDVTGPEELRGTLLARKAELQAGRLSDTEAAIEALRASIELAPRSRWALELLRGLYLRLGRWDALMDVLRQLSSVSSEPGARARLTIEMAELAETRLSDPAAAEELFAHALELDPACEKAAVALRRLYHAHGRWKDLADLLAVEAGREHEPDEMFADLYRAARIAEVHLQDEARAASLLETAAALRPGDPLPLGPLTDLYARSGRHDDEAAALNRRLRLVRDPAERAALCYRLGRVYEDWLVRTDKAVDSYRQALNYAANHEPALRALAGLYARLERWEELFELELLRAERSTDDSVRADGYVCAARICEDRLSDAARAVDLYERAWRLDSDLTEAMRALDRIYRKASRWEALAELYERRADETADTPLAVGLLRSAALTYEERLQNRERAVQALEKLRKLQPDDREALMQLARLYEHLGRMEDLRRALTEWAAVTEDERERIELLRRIGELLEGPLRKTEQAVEVYRDVLEAAPKDRPTRERLKAIFERTGRWNDLVQVLTDELEHEPGLLAGLQVQIGRICEDKLGDLDKAGAAYEAAVAADPAHTPALLALEELLGRRSDWARLVGLLDGQAGRTSDAAGAAALMCRAGELCEERLQDAAQAERCYNRALELEPTCGPARHGLERLYLSSGDRHALESHYLREAEGASNPVLRLRAYLRLGHLFEGPGEDDVGAAAAYESALKVMSDQPDALHGLASLYRRTGNWERLAELLARVAANTDDRYVAVSALKEWASIVELHLSDRWDPAPILERVLEADPHDIHALAVLEQLAFERYDLEQLVRLTRRQIQAGGPGEWTGSLCVRAAVLALTRARFKEAADILRQGLDAAPDYLPAIRLQRRIAEQLEAWDEAAKLLLREGELTAQPAAAAAALVRAGGILLDHFGEMQSARNAFERVLTLDPSNRAAFDRLVSILNTTEEWGALVDVYRQRIAAVSAGRRPALQLELGRILRDRLGERPAAIEVLEELLEADPGDRTARAEIAALCIDEQRWREAEQHLDHLSRVSAAVEERQRAKLHRAAILDEQLASEDEALEVLQAVLSESPGDREALGRCMKIYQRKNDWERTVQMLDELSRTGTPAARVDGLIDLAEIHSRTLGEPEKARQSLRRAAALCVETGEGIDRIRDYFERRGDFDGLVGLLGDALATLPPEGSPGSVSVRLGLARVLAGRLLRPAEAETEIRRALAANPASLEARLELAGLHLWGDNLSEATAEYNRVLDQQPLSQEAFRGLYRVHERRGNLDRAAGAAQVVCALGEPEEAERKIADQAEMALQPGLASAAATPLGVEGFWHLLAHQDEPAVARELLVAVADYIPQVFAAELEAARTAELIPLGDDEPLTARCRALGTVLGVGEFQVCVGAGKGGVGAIPIGGAPLRLLINERFAREAPPARFRFVVGRALAELLTRTVYLRDLQPRSVELLLAAIVEPFERGFGEYLGDGRLDDLVRSFARVVPRKLRRTFEEPARAYAAGQPVAVAAWRRAADRSAERCGLMLAGDARAALATLEQEAASKAVRAELMRYAVGPHLYEAHRRLGLAV